MFNLFLRLQRNIIFMKLLKYLILFVFISSCSSNTNDDGTTANPLDPTLYYQELDVSYGNRANQTFDLYLPANRTFNTKVLILVHGGGWSSGDKIDMNPIKDLIRLDLPNYAIVNMNYRLADNENKPYPMQTDDISSVISYLKNNEGKYTISDDYGFIGVSAGAHLSLLWSYKFDTQNHVKMVCSIVGPTNFTDPNYLNNIDPDLQAMLDLYGTNLTLEFLEEVSPYHQATSLSPPTILFYGGQDPLIPVSQGTDMRDKLISLSVINEFTLYPDAGHGWTGLELIDTWSKLKNFINLYL